MNQRRRNRDRIQYLAGWEAEVRSNGSTSCGVKQGDDLIRATSADRFMSKWMRAPGDPNQGRTHGSVRRTA